MGTPGEPSVRPQDGRSTWLRRHAALNGGSHPDVLVGMDCVSGQTFIVCDRVARADLDAWWARRLVRRRNGELL